MKTDEVPLPPEPQEETEFVVTDCSGQPVPEEIPLPEEPPQNDLEGYTYDEQGSCGSEADAEFTKAYELLYGNGKRMTICCGASALKASRARWMTLPKTKTTLLWKGSL